ncbi:MAG: cation:proton antiporter [Candidatus Symbiobacter sp.]|nr:cation:proton antiporter [Candidatus Symbiobacter sp.]
MSDFITSSIFSEISVLLVLAAVIGLVGIKFRQPLIVSFIIVGFICGPQMLGIVQSHEQINLFSELGIAVLLFLVGIRLDVQLVREVGGIALMAGLGQLFFTTLLGGLLAWLLGFPLAASCYIGFALALSSTIIIVKMLSDKHEIDSLHGQVALGILLVQDLAVILVMIMISAVGLGNATIGSDSHDLLKMGGASLLFLAAIILFMRFGAAKLTENFAASPDLLNIFAIALAALCAVIAEMIGLGKELGGLLAGVALAHTPYREAITARLGPLRDFLLLFFFVALGAKVNLSNLSAHWVDSSVFSLFVLIGNPLIVIIVMGLIGFTKRTSFFTSLTMSQVSEFSLILMTLAAKFGMVTTAQVEIVTIVAMVTIALSTYIITYSHPLFHYCDRFLSLFEFRPRNKSKFDGGASPNRHYNIIIFGCGRLGTAIALRFQARNQSVLGVDFNLEALRQWRNLGLDTEYGDGIDPEFLASVPLHSAEWVISTVPVPYVGITHWDPRQAMLKALQTHGFKGRIAVTSHYSEDSWTLVAAGSDLVLEPFQDAADRAVELITGVDPASNHS